MLTGQRYGCRQVGRDVIMELVIRTNGGLLSTSGCSSSAQRDDMLSLGLP